MPPELIKEAQLQLKVGELLIERYMTIDEEITKRIDEQEKKILACLNEKSKEQETAPSIQLQDEQTTYGLKLYEHNKNSLKMENVWKR